MIAGASGLASHDSSRLVRMHADLLCSSADIRAHERGGGSSTSPGLHQPRFVEQHDSRARQGEIEVSRVRCVVAEAVDQRIETVAIARRIKRGRVAERDGRRVRAVRFVAVEEAGDVNRFGECVARVDGCTSPPHSWWAAEPKRSPGAVDDRRAESFRCVVGATPEPPSRPTGQSGRHVHHPIAGSPARGLAMSASARSGATVRDRVRTPAAPVPGRLPGRTVPPAGTSAPPPC